jgi:hypothetical protein
MLLLEIVDQRCEIPDVPDVRQGADERNGENEQDAPRAREQPSSEPCKLVAVGDEREQHEGEHPREL